MPSETTPNIIKKTPVPQITPKEEPKLEPLPEPKLSLEERIINSLTVSAIKYSWIVNPTDNFTFKTQMFKPNSKRNYLDMDIRFAEDNAIINKLTYGHFPKTEQFYWILPDNVVIFETKGWQGGIVYQGRSEKSQVEVEIKLKQALGGYQAVWTLPQTFKDLTTDSGDKKNISIFSVAGQLTNPPGIKADRVNLNTKKYEEINANLVPNLGYASTRNIRGGGALFENLEISNTPLILQGFPTVNLKPLLNEGKVKLKVKEVIPESVLNAAGIYWANYNTGEEAKFTAPITSIPGIKIAQKERFDNEDLLNKLINPFLDQDIERDLAYLNSLMWVSFGQRKPEITVSDPIVLDNLHWYRLYFSRPHNRSLIQYNPEEISAIYANVFANPGVSTTINFNKSRSDDIQTLNQTLGMALGGIFEGVSVRKIDDRLSEAREKYAKNENFATVKTKATSLQRQQINQRLERNLFYVNLNSGLKQVSGTVTFPSKIRPNKSRMFQIRTGLHERGVYFVDRNLEEVIPGETFFSLLRLSNKNFGPLTFIGNPIAIERDPNIPKQKKIDKDKTKKDKQKKVKKIPKFENKNPTKIERQTTLKQKKPNPKPINQSSAVKTIINTENGQQFIREINSADDPVIPIGIRTYDLAFDRIEFTRIDRQNIHFNRYIGYLYLPAIEGAFSGSKGNLNYSINTGIWFNLDRNSAPSVDRNNFGIQESTLGIYANSLISYQFLDIELDKDRQPKIVRTHTPFLKVNWNSSSNSYNPFLAVASYSYYRQDNNLKLSLTPGIAFVEKNSNGEFTGIFDGNINIKNYLEFNGNAEIGKETFFSLEGLKRVSPNWAIGAYLQNNSFNKLNVGLNSRISNLNYGLLVRHNFKDNPIHFEGRIGTGEKGFDARFEGGYRF